MFGAGHGAFMAKGKRYTRGRWKVKPQEELKNGSNFNETIT